MKRGAPINRVSEKAAPAARKRGSTLKQGRGFAAGPEQQRKVKDLACLVCGKDRHEAEIHAAHVYARRFTPCDCADGVVPLCAGCHATYDDPNQTLDLLPILLAHGYRVELVHAIVIHEASPLHVLEQVTGELYKPVSEFERQTNELQARVVELEAALPNHEAMTG